VPKLLEAVRNDNRQAAEALLSRSADPYKKGEAASFPSHEAAAAVKAAGASLCSCCLQTMHRQTRWMIAGEMRCTLPSKADRYGLQ